MRELNINIKPLKKTMSTDPFHGNTDQNFRIQMQESIIELLRNRCSTRSNTNIFSKIPSIAKILERELFSLATTRGEYLDQTTLTERLKSLAISKLSESKRIGHPIDEENPKKRLKQEDIVFEEKECVICMTNPSALKFLPCMHFCTCSDCFQQIKTSNVKCPLCRSDIDNVITTSKEPTSDHRQQVLKQQQQRLLLLRHAAKCPHQDEGIVCPVTPHCKSMKTLWRHVLSCKDQKCSTAHCVSSRYVLSHYSKCKESMCPVCKPVRDAIQASLAAVQFGATPTSGTSSTIMSETVVQQNIDAFDVELPAI